MAVVGRPVVHFAYPHGKADRRVADIVRNAGYDAGVDRPPPADASRGQPLPPRSLGARTDGGGRPARRDHDPVGRGVAGGWPFPT